MTKFFRLLVRLRYWKRRALALERERDGLIAQFATDKAELERQVKAEFYRNLSREDMFVSATVMGSRNMFGVPPRIGPAQTQRPQTLMETAKPIISGPDLMEFEQYWLPDALRNNVTRQQAEQDFLRELAQRKALRDEPTIG